MLVLLGHVPLDQLKHQFSLLPLHSCWALLYIGQKYESTKCLQSPSVLPSQENSLLLMPKSWAFAEMIKVMNREGSWRKSRKRKLISTK